MANAALSESAHIIRFPNAKKRGPKVKHGPSAAIFAFPKADRSHWSGHHWYIFRYHTSCGKTDAEAAQMIEEDIADNAEALLLPTVEDQLLFLARRGLSRMRKIER